MEMEGIVVQRLGSVRTGAYRQAWFKNCYREQAV